MKKIKRLLSVVMAMLMVFTLFCSSIPAVSGAETKEKEWLSFDELVDRDGFINGIQQPWFIHNSTGNCIGKSFIDGYSKTFFDEALFYEVFTNSKAMGFDIVKLWLTYQFDGMVFDENGVVVGIEPTFLKNLPRVFEIAQECGVYICITVVNHFESATYRDGRVKYEEVFRFVYNPADTELFIKNFLKPVLEITKQFDNVIMADIFCEPESNGGQWGLQIGTRWEHIVRFVNRVCEVIEEVDPKLVTYSSASGSDMIDKLAETEPQAMIIILPATTNGDSIDVHVERTYEIVKEKNLPLIDTFRLWKDHYDPNADNYGHGDWLYGNGDACHPMPKSSAIMAEFIFNGFKKL